MDKGNRPDLIINGMVSASGGHYNEVKINGDGKVDGNLDCIQFKCNGHSKCYGDVNAKFTRIFGAAVVTGNFSSEKATINGQAEIEGDVSCKEVKLHGQLTIQHSLAAEELNLYGELEVKGDCQAEVFSAEGAFAIGGLLNAGNIDIRLHGSCDAREIGGETISVKRSKMSYLTKFFKSIFVPRLAADTIEGDEIYLEYTKAKVVRGKNVSIGPGCEIELVEYVNDFRQDKGAKVGDSKKV